MEISGVDHIFLYCIMLLLAYLYDRLSRENSGGVQYSRNAITPFILFLLGAVFVVTEGLRYGRGVDQCGNYGPFYLHCMNAKAWSQDFETMFVWLNQVVYKIDSFRNVWPFGSIFIVYALIFFICLMVYYRGKEKETKLFLVLAILATNFVTEWTIRQGVSFSFILLGLHYLEQKKWKLLAGSMIVAFGIHHGNALAISLPVIFYFFLNKRIIPWKISIPLFVVLEYTMQVSTFQNYVQILSSYINLSSLGGNFEHYVQDNSMMQEAELSAEWVRGSFTQFITVVFYSAILLVGAETCLVKPKKITYIYNSFVVAILIAEPFRLAGSITRLFNILSCMWFIPLSYAIFNYKLIRHNNKLVKWAMLCIALYIVTYYGRFILFNPTATYTWNL